MKKVSTKAISTFAVFVFLFTTFFSIFVLPQEAQAATKPKIEKKTLAAGTKSATPLYIIRSGKPGPVVMIVGGVHGNEPAGYKAAAKVVNFDIKRGTLLVIPQANKRAIKIHRRYVRGVGDLNRDFPRTKRDSADTALARAIYKVVKDYDVDWLMDMHEGFDYYKNKRTSSVGQTVIYYPNKATYRVASKIVRTLNKNISGSYRKFSLLRYPVRGSLARAAGQNLGVHSFILETCDNPSLSVRVNRQLTAAKTMLKELKMM
ncbi:MAG: M99 family carboxypeptidase catalytic domain-containing protein [Syntrophomonadaceae bacterium]